MQRDDFASGRQKLVQILHARRCPRLTPVRRGCRTPRDVPFYRPTKYELVLNQKAAASLGLEFPPMLLTIADAVIE